MNLYVHLLGLYLAFIGPFALLAAGAFEEWSRLIDLAAALLQTTNL